MAILRNIFFKVSFGFGGVGWLCGDLEEREVRGDYVLFMFVCVEIKVQRGFYIVFLWGYREGVFFGQLLFFLISNFGGYEKGSFDVFRNRVKFVRSQGLVNYSLEIKFS